MRQAYDTVADAYALHLPDTRVEAALDLAVLDHFSDAVAADGDGPVLDAGCGAGRITRHLADRGRTVQGVDLSPRMVAAARRAHPDLTFDVASIRNLPHADASFAGVLLWYSTVHTPPQSLGAVLRETARVLRPGGHVLVAVQVGVGVRDVAPAYRRFGYEVELVNHLAQVDDVATSMAAAGLEETCRLVRAGRDPKEDAQAMLLARRSPELPVKPGP